MENQNEYLKEKHQVREVSKKVIKNLDSSFNPRYELQKIKPRRGGIEELVKEANFFVSKPKSSQVFSSITNLFPAIVPHTTTRRDKVSTAESSLTFLLGEKKQKKKVSFSSKVMVLPIPYIHIINQNDGNRIGVDLGWPEEVSTSTYFLPLGNSKRGKKIKPRSEKKAFKLVAHLILQDPKELEEVEIELEKALSLRARDELRRAKRNNMAPKRSFRILKKSIIKCGQFDD